MFDSCRNLTYSLTHQIGAEIIQGRYGKGNFPTEAELSIEYKISRNVIREAIKMLTAKGLISSRPRKGITVMPSECWNMFDPDVLIWTLSARPGMDLLREFTQLRMAIEPEAARLAAANSMDGMLINSISLSFLAMKKKNISQQEFLEADIQFHSAILSASKNPYFLQMRQFVALALRCRFANKGEYSKISQYLSENQKILDAIFVGDEEMAFHSARAFLSKELYSL